MVSSDALMTLLNALELVPLAIILYAAYWAFDIRRALAIRAYKDQALGVGLLAVLFVYLIFLGTVGPIQVPYGALIGFLELILGLAGFIGALYFVDASMHASRRSDPLFRDTLHWSKVRYALWTYEIFAASFTALDSAVSMIHNLPSSLVQIVNLGYAVSFPFVFLVPIVSFFALIPVAVRARDPQLRGHFRWLSFVAVLSLTHALLEGFSSTLATATLGVLLASAAGYCLYRSARALVPLSRTPELDEAADVGLLQN